MASDIEYICPPYIYVASSIKSPPDGWHTLKRGANKNTKHFLEYVGFSDGHPQDLGYLRPKLEEEVVLEGNKYIKSIYDLSTLTQGKAYLVCGYAHTTIILSKTVDSTHEGCEVLHSYGDKIIKSISCN
ncbi:MAG: hypothetical protein PVI97_13630 [Candidatus Thiodiazotropha sp.]|jgi:hypothetical protein